MHRIKTPSAIPGSGLAATLAIVFALVSMAAGCRRESAEQALRGDIASLQAAIESRDAGEMAGFLAEDFVGNDGLDRDGAQRLAADRKRVVSGTRVAGRVDIGGRRRITKKKNKKAQR